jgi:hypothetical protein
MHGNSMHHCSQYAFLRFLVLSVQFLNGPMQHVQILNVSTFMVK